MRSKMLSRCSTLTAIAVSAVLLPLSSAHAATASGAVNRATADAFGRMADAVLTDRTAALLDKSQAAPRTALASKSTGGVRLTAALTKTEDTAVTSLRGTRSRLAALGEAYRRETCHRRQDAQVGQGGHRLGHRDHRPHVQEDPRRRTRHHGLRRAPRADLRRPAGRHLEALGPRTTLDKGAHQVNEPVTAAPAHGPHGRCRRPPGSDHVSRARQPQEAHQARTTTRRWRPTPEKYWKNYNAAYPQFRTGSAATAPTS